MEKARLETFGSNWPYDAVRGHGASSKKVSNHIDLIYQCAELVNDS